MWSASWRLDVSTSTKSWQRSRLLLIRGNRGSESRMPTDKHSESLFFLSILFWFFLLMSSRLHDSRFICDSISS